MSAKETSATAAPPAHDHRHQFVHANEGQTRGGQSLRQWTNYGDTGTPCKVKGGNDDGGDNHADQYARDARPALQNENEDESPAADCKGHNIRASS